MSTFPVLTAEQIEALARILGDCDTGSGISKAFATCGLKDDSPESTKWRRIDAVLKRAGTMYNSSNHAYSLIRSMLAPVKFVGRNEIFENARNEINAVLSFSGIEYGKDGNFRECTIATTITEARSRLQTIRNKLSGRDIHFEALKYCREELLADNYFHAVFEAVKGLEDRLRKISGVEASGADLVSQVFAVDNPVLALNSLQSLNERTEQKGFAALVKGCIAAVRHPLAHGSKIFWEGEDDAADYLTLISLLHRKLDKCVKVPRPTSSSSRS